MSEGARRRRSWSWFSHLPFPLRLALAALLGALGALGQAPYGFALVLVLACTAAFLMFRRTVMSHRAGLIGWAFGTGYFAHALAWIVEPFLVDAAAHGWMAPFALVFMAGGLALFWGAAFWAARVLSPRTWPLVVTWAAAELARAYVLTGFPWAGISQVVIDGAAARALAFAGPHGTTLWLLSLVWALSFPARGVLARAGQGAVLAALVVGLHVPSFRPPAALTEHRIRLVQPNAEQHLKWRPDMAQLFYARQLALTAAPPAEGQPAPDLVVWPETAIPWQLAEAGPALREIGAAAGGAPVALGVLRAAEGRWRNALAVVDTRGDVQAVYDKHHLVPFGEYIPLADLAGRVGLRGLAEIRGPGFGPGPGPVLLDLGALGRALPLICYEAVFAYDVNAAPARADFLLQITNDAWFGTWAGPPQHLAQARMRAIEQGLPLMRAANTGISAMIDPFGRVTASLPLGEAGFVDATLPQPLPPTLYSRLGDWPVALLLIFGIAMSRSRFGGVKTR
jgi:apolipoprotein N-acyltransferase